MHSKLPPPWRSFLRLFVSDAWEKGHVLRLLAATWPPAKTWPLGPWTVRDGQGGGKRVSAASLAKDAAFDPLGFVPPDVDRAEAAMQGLDQRPVFAVWPDEGHLDSALAQRGYAIVDPVLCLSAPVGVIAASLDGRKAPIAYPQWPPLALVQEIWHTAHVTAATQKIMARVQGTKTALALRSGDQLVGVCFVAMAQHTAMLHALQILPQHRRSGHGASLMGAAARWAAQHGAQELALLVTHANGPARALYESLGMTQRAQYHYRQRP